MVKFNAHKYSFIDKSVLNQPKFLGSKICNQPNKPLYKPMPYPRTWFQKDLLTKAVGGIGYLNLANKYGFGIWHKPLDYKTVPAIMDRSSPAMWV